jgi:hypothetical protein
MSIRVRWLAASIAIWIYFFCLFRELPKHLLRYFPFSCVVPILNIMDEIEYNLDIVGV